ncbi:hypothetical protein [Deinococcus planocerae]|uniref:hypothetical protein n=1 Tax=Deinococcus planocerae TaxID=1737569 RepID=UPI0011AF6646|nr:hypothetical protein [Deinococcus planocerae]
MTACPAPAWGHVTSQATEDDGRRNPYKDPLTIAVSVAAQLLQVLEVPVVAAAPIPSTSPEG